MTMKKIRLLLIYTPSCTPTMMPYSISFLKAILTEAAKKDPCNINAGTKDEDDKSAATDDEGKKSPASSEPARMDAARQTAAGEEIRQKEFSVRCLDLNAKFHRLRFSKYYDQLRSLDKADDDAYAEILSDFQEESAKAYLEINKKVVKGQSPDLLDELYALIRKENPTHVGLSLVYSSQAFYARPLIEKLSADNITCIVGGPAVPDSIKKMASCPDDAACFADELGLDGKKVHDLLKIGFNSPDFSDFDKIDYLTKEMIYPVRSSRGCPYGRCAFCTHHGNQAYQQIDLPEAEPGKKLFFIDDMIPAKRLLEIAVRFHGKNITWSVQLSPTPDHIPNLKAYHDAGLSVISWGVESGSQRVLDKMRKGTRIEHIKKVLKASADAGILNNLFIMFGFPTETEEEFLETIAFLKKNTKSIHLVSTSIFGLQQGSHVYENPSEYTITDIREEKRTVLGPKVSYTAGSGMAGQDAKRLFVNHKKTIFSLNKLPRCVNYMKEQAIFFKKKQAGQALTF